MSIGAAGWEHPMRRSVDKKPWLREPWWAEIGSGTAAILWAILALGFEFRLMDLASMRVLLTIADERVWQVVGLVIGVFQVCSALADHPWIRWSIALAAFGWWMLLFLAIAFASHTPSLALYFVFAALNLVPACRLLKLRV